MPTLTELQWSTSVAPGAFYAAAVVARGGMLVDGSLAEALREPLEAVAASVTGQTVTAADVLDQIAPLSDGVASPRELAIAAVAKTLGPGRGAECVPSLTRAIDRVEKAFRGALPDVAEQLPLRLEPLREQWEARGPGLLNEIGRRVDGDARDGGFLVERATVLLAYPALGGGGAAYPANNKVLIEAVLANAIAELPEVVRLGYLIAQLNLDLPRYQSPSGAGRGYTLGRLALVPVVIEAAEEVELARFGEATVGRALDAWGASQATSATMINWWETCRSLRSPWPVALGALEQMLAHGAGD